MDLNSRSLPHHPSSNWDRLFCMFTSSISILSIRNMFKFMFRSRRLMSPTLTPFLTGLVGSESTIPTLFPTPTPLVGTPLTPTPVITPIPGPREGLGNREGEASASLADVEGMFLFEEYCCCEGRGWVIIEVEDVAVGLGVPDSWNPECG